MFGSDQYKRIKDQGNLIFNSTSLKNLSKVERYEFLQHCHRRSYQAQEFIYHQGDPGTGMYFIEEGKIRLETQIEGSEEHISKTISAPDSFGVLSIGYKFRRFATVQCLSDCTLLGFFKPDFETLKKRQPHIAVKFMETLAMVAMHQLNTTVEALKDSSEAQHIVELIFKTYYDDSEQTDGIF